MGKPTRGNSTDGYGQNVKFLLSVMAKKNKVPQGCFNVYQYDNWLV